MNKNNITSGIYSIENIENKRIYIGLSVNIILRWKQHVYALRQNKHPNYYLQADWNKYNEDIFKFKIVEICDESKLSASETYWGAIYNCNDREVGYNITRCGGSVRRDEEQIKKAKLFEQKNKIYRKEIEDRVFAYLEEERLREEIKIIQRLPLYLYIQKMDELRELLNITDKVNLSKLDKEITEYKNIFTLFKLPKNTFRGVKP